MDANCADDAASNATTSRIVRDGPAHAPPRLQSPAAAAPTSARRPRGACRRPSCGEFGGLQSSRRDAPELATKLSGQTAPRTPGRTRRGLVCVASSHTSLAQSHTLSRTWRGVGERPRENARGRPPRESARVGERSASRNAIPSRDAPTTKSLGVAPARGPHPGGDEDVFPACFSRRRRGRDRGPAPTRRPLRDLRRRASPLRRRRFKPRDARAP